MRRHHFALEAPEVPRQILLEVAKEIRNPTACPLHHSIPDLIAATWALKGSASWEAAAAHGLNWKLLGIKGLLARNTGQLSLVSGSLHLR
jgi:hypothetical protein